MQPVMSLPAIMQPCWPPVLDKVQATECRSYKHSRSVSRNAPPDSHVDAQPGPLHARGRADGTAFGLPSWISFLSLTMRVTFLGLG